MAAPPRSAPATNPFIPPRAYATCGSPSIAAEESRQATINVLLLASRPILLAIGFEFGIIVCALPLANRLERIPKKVTVCFSSRGGAQVQYICKENSALWKPKRRRERRRGGLAGSIASHMCLNPAE